MSVIDIIILIVFVGAIIYGLYKGVIAQLGSLGGIILGIIACRLFGDYATEFVSNILPAMTSDPKTTAYVNSVEGNVLLFIVVYVLACLIAKLMRKITHALCLGLFDRLIGAVFCIFKWFFVVSILLNLWQVLSPETNIAKMSTLANGTAIQAIIDLAPTLFGSISQL